MKSQEPESIEKDWTFAYPAESSNPLLAPTGVTEVEATQKKAEIHPIEVKPSTAPDAISAESAGARKLHPRGALSDSDFQKLAQSSISREAAERAGIFRVDHKVAQEFGFRPNGRPDLAGVVFPYSNLEGNGVRGYRLRRDHPDFEQKDGVSKERAKYLSPPGQSPSFYVPPNLPPGWTQDASLQIVIAEGEKKSLAVDAISFHGLSDAAEVPWFATLGISGAWGWRTKRRENESGKRVSHPIRDFDLINWKNRRVTLWPDANFKTIESVRDGWTLLAEELKRRGAIVRFAYCPIEPGINGPDDAISKFGPEWGLAQIKGAIAVERPTEVRSKGLPIYDCAEFLGQRLDEEGDDYLVQGLIPRAAAVLLYSIPKSLKTWFVLQLAVDAACGRAVLGKWKVPQPVKTLVVQIEDRRSQLQKRLRQIISSQGGQCPAVGMLQVIPRCTINLLDPEYEKELETIIKTHTPQLVILDVMRRFFRGDVNSAVDTANFLKVVDRLRDAYGCTVLLVHHSKKSRESDMQSNVLGSTNLAAWADVLLEISNKKSTGAMTTAEIQIESKSDAPDEPTIVELNPNTSPMLSVLGCGSVDISRARNNFKDRSWTIKEMSAFLGGSDDTAQRRVDEWSHDELVRLVRKVAHGKCLYCFNLSEHADEVSNQPDPPKASPAELHPIARAL